MNGAFYFKFQKTKLLPYTLQLEHRYRLGFGPRKHHLLYVQKARICYLQHTPADKLLAGAYTVNPKFQQSTYASCAVHF